MQRGSTKACDGHAKIKESKMKKREAHRELYVKMLAGSPHTDTSITTWTYGSI